MSQWKKDDSAANSVLWGVVGYNKTGNSVNRDAFFDNVSRGSFVTNLIVGQFGVDSTEAAVNAGNVVHITVTNAGSGYTANTSNGTFTVVNGGSGANAFGIANTFGKISSINISNGGTGYIVNPTFVLPAPANTTFNANSAVTAGAGAGANSVITISSAGSFVAGDPVIYYVANGNTALTGLANGTTYWINFANATVVALTATANSTAAADRTTLTKGLTETGHILTGVTATATAVVGGAKNKGVQHAGWVVRKVGTGGRAGRVQYETLVAMGSMTGDATDDSILPDS